MKMISKKSNVFFLVDVYLNYFSTDLPLYLTQVLLPLSSHFIVKFVLNYLVTFCGDVTNVMCPHYISGH